MKSTTRSLQVGVHAATRSLILILLVAAAGWGLEAKRQFYVLNTKPPSISIVDSDGWKLLSTIPLDPEPTYVVVGSTNRFLYVLHRGLFRPNGMLEGGVGELSIVDLEARKPIKKIPLGWNVSNVALSKDGRYVLCVSQGKSGKKKLPEESGSITIVDTQKNDVSGVLSAGRLGVQVIFTSDVSRIFVLSQGEPPKKKGGAYTKPVVTAFALDSEEPLASIELERAQNMTLSRDEKWLYVLDGGVPSKKPKDHRNGGVHVVDVSAAKLAGTFELGTLPRHLTVDPETDSVSVLTQASVKDRRGKLYQLRGTDPPLAVDVGSEPSFVRRLANHRGVFAVTHEDIRFLPDGAPATSALISLNPVKGAPSPAEAIKRLGGYPGEVLYLPDQDKAVLTVKDAFGTPTSKVAILNLKDNKVEQVITTGRGSVKFGKIMGAMALSVAMSSLSYYAGYSMAQATGSPYFYYNVYSFHPASPNLELSASPDGKFIYALNTFSNDVTIINSADGTVIERVAVGGGCRRLGLAPGGKFVYSNTSGQFNLINTQTNKKHLEYKLPSGRINNLRTLEPEGKIVALTSKSLLIWDAESGEQVATVEGFNEPYLLLEPAAP
jgi:YVTN family beta-propeller protein